METTPPPESRPAPLESTPLDGAPPGGAAPPPLPSGPAQQPGAPNHKGANSLVLAILAPASMFLTGPFAGLAMLLTYSDNGHSSAPWVAPFVLFSLPLLFASLGLRLALPALKELPRGSGRRSAAAVALCICGLVFALALGPALDLLGVF